jgi:protein gp37
VLRIREQCDRANVPFFFKQWGGVRKAKAGRMLDSRTYDDMTQRSTRAPADQLNILEMVEC